MRRAFPYAFALLAVVACAAGCARPNKVILHPVEGRLTVSGSPAANAQLAFHPLEEGVPAGVLPVARTGADGSYRLTTYAAGDGAPAGEYAVTVVWPDDSIPQDECADPAAHDRLNQRYADPARTRLRATVRPGYNEVNLKAAVAGSWSLPRTRGAPPK